jgi:cytochrome c5
VGSLLNSKIMAKCVLTIMFALGTSHAIADAAQHDDSNVVDGVYATYPATKSQDATVMRGEYLAKMGDCIACHSNPKAGTPAYAGGLPIATPFGTFYSPNITPDVETGIGAWSEADFIRALKEGKNPQGQHYFPVFPYVYFANVSDDDARAMYAYFKSIPAVHQPNKSLPFPFNLPGARTTLLGWNLLFFYPNSLYEYDAKQTETWNRGKYIVDGLGHCSMCHTPLNALGSPKLSNYLTGGFIDGYWAPNITSRALEGVSDEAFTLVFSHNKLLHNAGPVAGSMAEVNHDSLRHLTHADHLAIAEYLKTVVSTELHGVPGSDEKPTLSRGKQVYLSSCVLCHQNGEMAAPIIGNGQSWYRRLKESGLTGLYRHAIRGYNSMPLKGACVTCSDNDIIASVDYLLQQSLSRSQRLDLMSDRAKQFSANGRDIYRTSCSVCHSDPKSGAPLVGDKKVWAPLIAQNMDVLVDHALHSSRHPAHAGCETCTTGDILDAIKYMVTESKTKGNYSLW